MRLDDQNIVIVERMGISWPGDATILACDQIYGFSREFCLRTSSLYPFTDFKKTKKLNHNIYIINY